MSLYHQEKIAAAERQIAEAKAQLKALKGKQQSLKRRGIRDEDLECLIEDIKFELRSLKDFRLRLINDRELTRLGL